MTSFCRYLANVYQIRAYEIIYNVFNVIDVISSYGVPEGDGKRRYEDPKHPPQSQETKIYEIVTLSMTADD